MDATLRSRARVGFALAASLASVMLGYLLMGHFVMATLAYAGMLGAPPRGGWLTTVKQLTHSRWIFWLIGWALLVPALGWAAWALAARDPDRRNRASLAAIAARFALGGLVAGVVDVVLVGTMVYIGRIWLYWY